MKLSVVTLLQTFYWLAMDAQLLVMGPTQLDHDQLVVRRVAMPRMCREHCQLKFVLQLLLTRNVQTNCNCHHCSMCPQLGVIAFQLNLTESHTRRYSARRQHFATVNLCSIQLLL
jgi:hypothetical protein